MASFAWLHPLHLLNQNICSHFKLKSSSIQNSGSVFFFLAVLRLVDHNRDVIGRNRSYQGWMVSYGNVDEVTVDRFIVKPINSAINFL